MDGTKPELNSQDARATEGGQIQQNMEEDVDTADVDMTMNDEKPEGPEAEPQVYLPGQSIDEGEELVMDESAYVLYHQANLGAPCLSFDVIHDEQASSEFPLSVLAVAGTQASRVNQNNILLFNMFNLEAIKRHRKKQDEDEASSEDSDSDEEEEDQNPEKLPKLKMAAIKHPGCINRIRFRSLGSTSVVAAWSETGSVGIWSLETAIAKLEECPVLSSNRDPAPNTSVPRDTSTKPLFCFTGHQTEGFAIDWSNTVPGMLASGDCKKNIHVWRPSDSSASWVIDPRPLVGHSSSVEDVQWSPNEPHVLASCSVDKSIRIWDCRAPPEKACMLSAHQCHDSDVNVIHWNPNEPFLASGGDEGHLKVWDLRVFNTSQPVAVFRHHSAPITSVEWHKDDSTVLASSGADNQVALWDLAVERDDDDDNNVADSKIGHLPPQLLFIHQGLEDVKEIHWHPQMPGLLMATSHTGFDVFKTISV